MLFFLTQQSKVKYDLCLIKNCIPLTSIQYWIKGSNVSVIVTPVPVVRATFIGKKCKSCSNQNYINGLVTISDWNIAGFRKLLDFDPRSKCVTPYRTGYLFSIACNDSSAWVELQIIHPHLSLHCVLKIVQIFYYLLGSGREKGLGIIRKVVGIDLIPLMIK